MEISILKLRFCHILAGNEFLSTTSPSLRSGTPPFQGGEFFVNHKRRTLPSGNYRNKSPVSSEQGMEQGKE